MNTELKYQDLMSAILAMESWLDGPGGDEEEWKEDAKRVERALHAFRYIASLMDRPEPERHLKLVRPLVDGIIEGVELGIRPAPPDDKEKP